MRLALLALDRTMTIPPQAGTAADLGPLVDLPRLVSDYYTRVPDPQEPRQRVAFGTSGHRGSSLEASFNEAHIVAITAAICRYRRQQGTTGPLFLGIDTHALSIPAYATALEVLAAHAVDVVIAEGDEYTPTPVISHAILGWNRGRPVGLADGIVITPSHNPPGDGGFKYNPPSGGPAAQEATGWIERTANQLLEHGLVEVPRLPLARALAAGTTRRRDYLGPYIADLANVVDLDAVRGAQLDLGVDPLGGAGVHYWGRIAEHHHLDLTVVSTEVDATFRFMTRDWDGKIRMDPSSPYAMQRLIAMKERFALAFACDTDHDRHGIVTRSVGLLPANHYLCALIWHLFNHRPAWAERTGIGKTAVSTRVIDLIAARLGRHVLEVPVGFKWFVPGLLDGSLGFVGEESAGATCLRRDGTVWTTDKDGIVPALLAAEMTARAGRDPGEIYQDLTRESGAPVGSRSDAPVTAAQRKALAGITPDQVALTTLAGDPVRSVTTTAPGNGAALGGLKAETEAGWFAVRPSGTEDIYRLYAESFRGDGHLQRIVDEARAMVADVLRKAATAGAGGGAGPHPG
jgi:phosphoglucomutase